MPFKDIKGQDKTLEILRRHLEQKRLAKAYLFSGPQGVGKRLAAKTLAKALNCQQENLDSCDRCASCLKIEKNQHPDVHIIDREDAEIKIEDIRQLQNEISLKPYEGRYKVFMIKNAHHLNVVSSNAFLKTLEEAMGVSLIILITEKPALLLETILSRCQVLKFYPLPRPGLEGILKDDYGLGEDLAHFLAYFCEGRLGEALRLKDTAIFQNKNRIINELIFPQRNPLDNLPVKDREGLRSYLNILSTWFRDIYLIKIGLGHRELINFDRQSDLLNFKERFSFAELDRIINFISEALFYAEHNINIKLLQANLRLELWKG